MSSASTVISLARAAASMFRRSTLSSCADFFLTVPYVVKGWLFADGFGVSSVVLLPFTKG